MRFDVIYEQLIVELFNTKQHAEWIYEPGMGYTTVLEGPESVSYLLSLVPFWDIALPPRLYNNGELTSENWNTLQEGAWHVEFSNEDVENINSLGIGITGDQGSNAAKVFGLIGNALLDKVSSSPDEIKSLIFQAEEPSRRKLYSRLAPVLAKKLNKDLVTTQDKEWFFILAKN